MTIPACPCFRLIWKLPFLSWRTPVPFPFVKLSLLERMILRAVLCQNWRDLRAICYWSDSSFPPHSMPLPLPPCRSQNLLDPGMCWFRELECCKICCSEWNELVAKDDRAGGDTRGGGMAEQDLPVLVALGHLIPCILWGHIKHLPIHWRDELFTNMSFGTESCFACALL